MSKSLRLFAIGLITMSAAAPARGQGADGGAVFARHCAACHAGGDTAGAPTREQLRERTPEAILNALVSGAMRAQAAALSEAERRAVVEYLSGGRSVSDTPAPAVRPCATARPLPSRIEGPVWSGWGVTPANTRFQPAAHAGLTADQVRRLRFKWAFGFQGASSARAQPAVLMGRMFLGSETGVVHALDAKTGCTYWTFTAKAAVRTAIAVGPHGNGHGIYFGDISANAYALDAATGALLWTRRVDDHQYARITGSPTLHENLLYVPVAGLTEEEIASNAGYPCCTFRGSVVALDARTGEVRWKTYTIEAPTARGKGPQGQTLWGPSGVSIWSAPTIDAKRRVLYVGTGNLFSGPLTASNNAIIAMDLDSGAVRWINQRTANDISIAGCRNPSARRPNCPEEPVGPDLDFGSSPMLVNLSNGRDVIVAAQKSGMVWGLDPDNKGTLIWQYRAGKGGHLGGTEWGAAADGDQVYVPIVDEADAEGHIPGGLHGIRAATGERIWFVPPRMPICGNARGCTTAQSAAITTIPGVVFSGSFDGAIRAFSTRDGSLLWEFDTNRMFETVNGVTATGAAIGGGGPVIVDGMLYANSGYSYAGGRPGNVLLAFEVGPE